MDVVVALWTNNCQMETRRTNMDAFFQTTDARKVKENGKMIFLLLLLPIKKMSSVYSKKEKFILQA